MPCLGLGKPFLALVLGQCACVCAACMCVLGWWVLALAGSRQLASWEAQGNVVEWKKASPSWAGGVRRPLHLTLGKRGFGGKIIAGKALALFLQGSGKHTDKCKPPLLYLYASLDSRKYYSMLYVSTFDMWNMGTMLCTVVLWNEDIEVTI